MRHIQATTQLRRTTIPAQGGAVGREGSCSGTIAGGQEQLSVQKEAAPTDERPGLPISHWSKPREQSHSGCRQQARPQCRNRLKMHQ